MHNFNNLVIWKDGIQLSKEIYSLVKSFPQAETYGMVSQITRAAVSVPSNIAEGAGRDSDKEFSHFLSIAIGSLFELQTQIIISKEIGYIPAEKANEILNNIDKLQKMINAYRLKLAS